MRSNQIGPTLGATRSVNKRKSNARSPLKPAATHGRFPPIKTVEVSPGGPCGVSTAHYRGRFASGDQRARGAAPRDSGARSVVTGSWMRWLEAKDQLRIHYLYEHEAMIRK